MKLLALVWIIAVGWLGGGAAWSATHARDEPGGRAPFFLCHLG